ncbi:MAG: ABC transporter ATP-binding protein, partial [Desulfobacterales bacterium]|nr:ABC transporter ATP-binding protein [Desulfobacterales bacterium]
MWIIELMNAAIKVENLSKRYQIGKQLKKNLNFQEQLTDLVAGPFRRLKKAVKGEHLSDTEDFWALNDVSFEVQHGEVIGIIGRNGAGKSTLLKILSRITKPTTGRIVINGRVASLLEVGTGFHPELTGRENVYLNGSILGMRKTEIDAKFDEIVEFSGIEKFLDTPVKRYSSGMYVRLAFSVAAHLDPEILIVDEVLAVGDAEFQKRCLGKMQEVSTTGKTVLFVSHNMSAVLNLTTRCILLAGGRISTNGSPQKVVETYMSQGHEVATVPLGTRSDREGSQQVRFVDFHLLDGSQQRVASIPAGEDAILRFFYEGEQDELLPQMHVSVALFAESGESVLHLSSEVTCGDFSNVKSTGFIDCRIPGLPLQPGSYLMNVFLRINGVIADWVRDAAVLEVGIGDP